jgi:hypothetical protein
MKKRLATKIFLEIQTMLLLALIGVGVVLIICLLPTMQERLEDIVIVGEQVGQRKEQEDILFMQPIRQEGEQPQPLPQQQR